MVSEKEPGKMNKYKITFLTIASFAISALLIFLFFPLTKAAVLNPKGLIAVKQRELLIEATCWMLLIVIPVFILAFFIPWKYRASNHKAEYRPNWDYNFVAEALWWGLPCVIIVILSVMTWKSSHELDPFRPLESDKKPLKIQVVALQWKWLFIYPEQKIATVNFVQFPEKTPITFEITSDAPMNSFWIPQLAGQIYAMPAMRTYLHLIANEIGEFQGSSANLSGTGFANMRFIAKASTELDFNKWVQTIQQSQNSLDYISYQKLVPPSERVSVTSYLLKDAYLFNRIIMNYMLPMTDKQNESK